MDLIAALRGIKLPLARIGLEACSLTAWLHDGLRAASLAAICIETRQANRAMKTMPNKTDRTDPRALAQIMRTGWFRQVHVKSRQCRLWRSLLVARRSMLNEIRTIENVVRVVLREGGLKLGTLGQARFAARVRELARDDRAILVIAAPLLKVLETMLEELARLTKKVLDIAGKEAVCRRLMSVPGIGPITAFTFRATIDRPELFCRSRAVGAHLGLTPARYQSGETDIQGAISRCDDELARTALYERGPYAAGTRQEMVGVTCVGHEDRQTLRPGARPRRRGPQARGDSASHVARRKPVPLRQRASACSGGMSTCQRTAGRYTQGSPQRRSAGSFPKGRWD